MAIYHLSLKPISRGQGRSSVAAAAYRSGEKLYNNYDGLTHDYSGRKGVVYSEILLPDKAPREFLDRQTLWNAVESAEKRSDARTAREVEIALPNELTRDEQINMVRDFVADNFLSEGLCADIAIHAGKHEHEKSGYSEESKNDKMIAPDNPHAHILLADRPVNENGFLQKKNAQLNKKEYLQKWRKNFADIQNREFEKKGLEVRVSHESNADRGIEREPTIHLGYAVAEMEKRGIATDRGNENRAIVARNRARDERERLHKKNNIKDEINKEPTLVMKVLFDQTQLKNSNGGEKKTLFEIQNAEDKKGREKAREHINDLKTRAELERMKDEARNRAQEQTQIKTAPKNTEKSKVQAELDRMKEENKQRKEQEKTRGREEKRESRSKD